MHENTSDLYKPIESSRVGPPPIVIRAIVTSNQDSIAGGVPQSTKRAEDYVLISCLPKELQERVKTAVQALIAGM